MKYNTPHACNGLKIVRLLILDVDGVLTRGQVIYDDRGLETKIFDVKDGLGLRLLMDCGIMVVIATGRCAPALRHRCHNLGITRIYDGLRCKSDILEPLSQQCGLAASQMAFVGDDLPDLGLMAKVGLAVAVADATPEVKAAADIITKQPGGQGAVRELCEAILKAQGQWEVMVENIKNERL